ncbi:MAG: MMPL family transporter [Pseudomonadota bacterium]|nr:MMPL family transporter [Pseudomonadota bacterium]
MDDSIHILKRYLGFRKTGLAPALAIERTFEQVGAALMLTTLVLTLGMGILMLSIFGPNQTTAILMASIIAVALLYDLIMLPHLLQLLDRWLLPGTRANAAHTSAPAAQSSPSQ